jgi:hypothetical protein
LHGCARQAGQLSRPSPPKITKLEFVLLVVLVTVLVAVPALQAGRHYQRGVEGRCAVHFEADKPDLAGYYWNWWWLPGWVCEFERDGRRWERRLW